MSINCNFFNTPLLKRFFDHYQIWVDYKNVYVTPDNKVSPRIVTDTDRAGINCYMSTNVTSMVQDLNKVIFVDNLTEIGRAHV